MKNKVPPAAAASLLLCAALLTGCGGEPAAEASPAPWPTHEPGATPYVRLLPSEEELMAQREASVRETQVYDSAQELLRSMYDEVGKFYFIDWEHEMFLELPQDEPFRFVVKRWRDDEQSSSLYSISRGSCLRAAEEFTALGCDCEVRALRQISDGVEFEHCVCIVTMTPAKMWELSETAENMYFIEQLYESVDWRFTETVWPEQ